MVDNDLVETRFASAPATVKFKSRFVSRSHIELIAARKLINRTDVPSSLKQHDDMITIYHYGRQISELAWERQVANIDNNYFAKIHVEILLCGFIYRL